MPEIFVYQFEGRTAAQKRRLVRLLTDAFVDAYGVRPEQVTVQLIESSRANRAKGGVLYADLDTAEQSTR